MSKDLEKPTVVMADLHGYSAVLEKAVKEYGDVDYVLLGDSIGGGPDSAGVLDIADEVDAQLTWGNWEMYIMAGLVHHDLEKRQLVQDVTKPFDTSHGMLQSFARSYGVDTKLPKSEIIENITAEMQAKGHLNMLARAAMYVETDEFIGIHAGLTPYKSWEKQKQDLAKVKGTFDEARQLVDYTDHRLSKRQKAYKVTDKIVLTGHTHKIKGERITDCGKRVRLGSQLYAGEPLFVWQSWDKKIEEFSVNS
jgi:predicted phosphodiesterase